MDTLVDTHVGKGMEGEIVADMGLGMRCFHFGMVVHHSLGYLMDSLDQHLQET